MDRAESSGQTPWLAADAPPDRTEEPKRTPWRSPEPKRAQPRPVKIQAPKPAPTLRAGSSTIVTRVMPIAFLCICAAVVVVFLAWPR